MFASLRHTLICISLILLISSHAQGDTVVKCGHTLRVTIIDGATLQGELSSKSTDSLVLRSDSLGSRTIWREDISQMQLVERRTGSGALIGCGIGAVIGVLLVLAELDPLDPDSTSDSDIKLIGSILLGGTIGGAIGHSRVKLTPLEFDAVPACGFSPKVGINFTLSF